MTDIERADPPLRAGEADTLIGYLDFHRDTLRQKTDGLSAEQLRATLAPSTMTLGGMVKHLALVETWWFNEVLLGNPQIEAVGLGRLGRRRRLGLAQRRRRLSRAAARAVRTPRPRHPTRSSRRRSPEAGSTSLWWSHGADEGAFSLRWIIVHMIEEYARHNGHADLLRESIDGVTGE